MLEFAQASLLRNNYFSIMEYIQLTLQQHPQNLPPESRSQTVKSVSLEVVRICPSMLIRNLGQICDGSTWVGYSQVYLPQNHSGSFTSLDSMFAQKVVSCMVPRDDQAGHAAQCPSIYGIFRSALELGRQLVMIGGDLSSFLFSSHPWEGLSLY